MRIIEIIKDFDAYPIRWNLLTDDKKVITVRERGCLCVVYWGTDSIFSITDEDIILKFETEETAEDKTLLIALDKMNVEIDDYVLKNIGYNDLQFGGGSIDFKNQ